MAGAVVASAAGFAAWALTRPDEDSVTPADSATSTPTDETTESDPADDDDDTDDGQCGEGYYWVDQGDCEQCYRGCVREGEDVKPILYLYPTEETRVSVKLSNPEALTAQYPAYGDGWEVVAQPDGDLTQVGTGLELYSLYYEARRARPAEVTGTGFVVPGDQTAAFLEETLPKLGLSPHEAQEFIVYWLPRWQDNAYTYVRFETAAEIDQNQTLTITPQPETLIRVRAVFKALNEPIEVTPQTFTTPQRTGFVAVEWGATEIP
jgi:hypothetical protein